MLINKLGKLIVIDGTDGSGKATQTKLLVQRLKEAGFSVETADFPQYGKKSAGLVEEYLNGKYGSPEEVGPYLASIFYAVDRYDAGFQIKKWLSEGKIVISNRYVTANMGHQGGKIKNPEERQKYFSWLHELEYKLFGIPQPDLNIILHVPAETAQSLVDKKESREYIHSGKRDIHEADLNHLKNAEKVYLEIANSFPNITPIECVEKNYLMAPEKINNLIWEKILELIGAGSDNNIEAGGSLKNLYENIIKEKMPLSPNFIKPFRLAEIKEKNDLEIELISEQAKIPTRAHQNDAGLDLYANDNYSLLPGGKKLINTGVKMAIPKGFAGFIWDKSGLAGEGLHTMGGVIDSGYRGEILINIINLSQDIINIARGQKIAQIIIQKIESPEIQETKIDDKTERGDKGFGSTGKF
jgi:dTMP kinase